MRDLSNLRVFDTVKDPTMQEVDYILSHYEAQWVEIGTIMITKVLSSTKETAMA